MGINRISDIEERKRNDTDAKAGEETPRGRRGTPPSTHWPPRGLVLWILPTLQEVERVAVYDLG
jgi:hypothetical protein